MKKLWIIGIIMTAGLCMNVKAANFRQCETSFNQTNTKNEIYVNIAGVQKRGYVWMGNLINKTTGKSNVGLCLDLGKSSRNGATYILHPNSNKVAITSNMKRAYAFVDGYTYGETTRYLVAQLAVWLEQEGGWNNTLTFQHIVEEALLTYHCGKDYLHSGQCKEVAIVKYRKEALRLVNLYVRTKATTKNLCVYVNPQDPGSNYNTKYQRFLAECISDRCPDDYEKEEEEEEEEEITTCGKIMKPIASPATCSLTGQSNYGYFSEEVVSDPDNCGEANEAGAPERELGSYCYLYCSESVEQHYPGGISGPITLGTNIVWPTSTQTQETIWGNLYSLGYTGTKTCKIKVAPNTKQKDTPLETNKENVEIIRKYQNSSLYKDYKYGNCKNDLSQIRNEKSSALIAADAQVKAAQNNVSIKLQEKEVANKEYENARDAYNKAMEDYYKKKPEYDACERQAQYLWQDFYACRNKCNGASGCIEDCDRRYEYSNGVCRKCQCNMTKPIEPSRQDLTNKETAKTNAENAYQKALEEQNAAKNAYAQAETNLKIAEQNLSTCNSYVKAYDSLNNIVGELLHCLNYTIAPEDLYKFESSTSIEYTDPEYGASYPLTGTTTYQCASNNCSAEYKPEINEGRLEAVYNDVLNKINNTEIKVTATATYTLPNDDTIYKYINKKNNQPSKVPTEDYIDVGYGFLPTSFNASTKQKYQLKIVVNSLGQNGKFTEVANQNTYTCNYSHTNAKTDECVCPIGTAHEGEDLFPIIYNGSIGSTPMTCSVAQSKYCGETTTELHYCPTDSTINITSCIVGGGSFQHCVETLCPGGTGDKFCPNDKTIKITGCLNSGNSYNFCVEKLCNNPGGPPDNPNPPDDDYHCPKGTWNDGMDIKPCVYENIGPNFSLQEAINYCVETVCPYRGGINIIYRTISLRNPFPGKTASVGNLITTRNFSLDNLKGRYPGSNWNNVGLVKTQILNNRGVEADQVYTKTPLYSFILDTNTVKNIRNYNKSREKNGGYADFTLACKNGVACLSDFIRDPQYGLVDGACKDDSHSNFYNCSES